jgi:EmrB/QacA subfamily drug resistance transporter
MRRIHDGMSIDHLRLQVAMSHDNEMQNSIDQKIEPEPERSTDARPTLIAACASGFLFQFDLTALSAALPDIGSSLSVRVTDQAWIIHVYSLALIFALPMAGPMADRFGRHRLFMTGTLIFAIASVMCAMSTTLFSLLAWRVLQGIAGAALTASSAALLAAAYPGTRRARAFGILGTVVGASMVAGPPLGALIAAIVGWQWVFWINLPICLGLLFLTFRLQSEQSRPKAQNSLDWAGPAALAICVGSLAFLMLAVDQTSHLNRPNAMWALLGLCVVAFTFFIVIERRHVAPAFDLVLFGSSKFVAMCLVPIASSIGYWSLLVYLPQMARGPMGLSPAATGILLTAMTIPMFVLPSVGAKLATKLSAKWYFTFGLGIIGVADLFLALAALNLGSPMATLAVVGALLVSGAGCAMFNAQITAAAVSSVPPDRAATAAAICVTMRQIGFAFGIALIGALLQQNDPVAFGTYYTTAFGVVSACTLCLAAIVFTLLGQTK